MYKVSKLKNGLTVLKVPIRGARSVIVDMFVKAGSRNEEKNINGISHFLEHLFFKGSKRFPTAHALSHALDAIGAEYNANTGKEHTQYYIKAAKKHLKFIFETLIDVVQNPIFAPEEIEREKGVIVEEINMYEDTPIRDVDDKLESLMWPRHPLGRNIAGTKAVVKGISRPEIINYKSRYYQPGNMILSVGGAYQEKLLDDLVRRYWSKQTARRVPKWQRAASWQRRPVFKLFQKPTEQYHLSLGFRSYDYNHKRNSALLVLSVLLGGGMSSRLFIEVRERRGLAYYVKAEAASYQDTGNFVIKAGVRSGAFTEAVGVIIKELHKIKQEPLSEAELNKAKEYLKGTLTLALEDSEALLGWYLSQVAFRKKILTPEAAFEELSQVSAADVQAVARDILRSSKLNLAVIGPRSSASLSAGRLLRI